MGIVVPQWCGKHNNKPSAISIEMGGGSALQYWDLGVPRDPYLNTINTPLNTGAGFQGFRFFDDGPWEALGGTNLHNQRKFSSKSSRDTDDSHRFSRGGLVIMSSSWNHHVSVMSSSSHPVRKSTFRRLRLWEQKRRGTIREHANSQVKTRLGANPYVFFWGVL